MSALALAIAGYAAVLPFLLPLLNRLGGSPASLVLVKVTIALLTLVLAALVGMQFPLANRLEFDGTVAGASRLYTADFVGAFLGALLACTLLIPLIGVFGVCWLTAALNVAAGFSGRPQDGCGVNGAEGRSLACCSESKACRAEVRGLRPETRKKAEIRKPQKP